MSENTIDQQFIEYVVKSLVSKPEEVKVERKIDEKGVLLTLTVDPEDLGRVIGKRGATAQSMRTLLRALGTKQEARFNLKIVDNGPEDYVSSRRDDDSSSDESDSSSEEDNNSSSENTVADGWNSGSDDSSDGEDSSSESNDDDEDQEEESAVERTRRELEDLDDLDV